MPFYVYEVILEDDEPGQVFEVMQMMSEDPLKEHPQTGQPVRRVIQAPHISGKYAPDAMKKVANDDKKLNQLGFTKYVKQGDGTYEKRAGKGPDLMSADGPISP